MAAQPLSSPGQGHLEPFLCSVLPPVHVPVLGTALSVISSGAVEQKALLYQETCRRETPPMFLIDLCSIMDFFLFCVLLQSFRPTLWLWCFCHFKLYCLNGGSRAVTLRT